MTFRAAALAAMLAGVVMTAYAREPEFAADEAYGRDAMAVSRRTLSMEHGGMNVSKVMTRLLEYQSSSGRDGYRWDVEGRYGGDRHRLVFKSEGDGESGSGAEAADVQALYSRAVARYTDVQAGLHHEFRPGSRTDAVIGVETLLPYWFEIQGALFLSQKGDALARLEGTYDLQLTQRLVLQPRVELNLAARDVPSSRIGSGLSNGEFALRLRYEIRREFAPYLGISHDRTFGGSATLARAAGLDVRRTSVVLGLRAWF